MREQSQPLMGEACLPDPTRETAIAAISSPSIAYRSDIDGLRAVAALAVVGGHAGWLPGGGYGVDVFFVISGFLISGIIFRALGNSSFSFVDFYARRVKRIFPALLALLILVWLIGWITLTKVQYTHLRQDIAAGAAFSENVWFYATASRRTTTPDFLLTHLWTLGIEEQFYLLWPIFLWATWKFGKMRVVLMASVATISLTSYLWISLTDPTAAWLLPWNRLWELALGSLLAFMQLAKPSQFSSTRSKVSPKRKIIWGIPASQCLGTIGAVCMALSLAGFEPMTSLPSTDVLMPAIASFLLIWAGGQCWVNRLLLSAAPMVKVGLSSYPLYLWHVSFFVLAVFFYGHLPMSEFMQTPESIKVSVAIFSIVLAHFTYRYLERPIRRSGLTKQLASVLCVLMTLCGGIAYVTAD